MKIYLAGGINGNLKPLYNQLVKDPPPYEAEDIKRAMKIYLAGNAPWKYTGLYDDIMISQRPYILESFFYVDKTTEAMLPLMGDFLLDSGAFTFMQNTKTHVNWADYLEQYVEFINRNNIDKFFELDIDSVVGYKKVLELRAELESATGKRCIPVWHVSRGLKEYQKMCDEYDYVAIGGIVSKNIGNKQFKAFPSMIAEAHRRGAKVHGLGFTSLQWLSRCHFDSVDSTAWLSGNRFGYIYKFDGSKMTKLDCPENNRLRDPRTVALNNFIEWVKFQKYAEANL